MNLDHKTKTDKDIKTILVNVSYHDSRKKAPTVIDEKKNLQKCLLPVIEDQPHKNVVNLQKSIV